jgi:MFS family permease
VITEPRTAVRRLALARLISVTGGAAAYAALNFAIYERTGSATWIAAALFLTFGTVGFVSPVAGFIGDRFDRRRVMIVSDLLGAACFLGMGLAQDPGLLLVFAFLSALAEAPFFSASSAAIPNLVPDSQIGWANGMVSLGRNAGILIGPALGGLLVASVGAEWVFFANAVSFVLSAAIVITVTGRFAGDRPDVEEHQGLRAGFRFVFRDRVLRTITLAWLALVLGLGMSMVADVPLAELFGTGAFGYGLIISAWGGGSVLGSLAGRWVTARNEPWVLVVGTGVIVLTAAATGLSPWFAGVVIAVFVMGMGDGATLVAEQGIMQRRTPDAVRSRVAGAFDAFVHVGLAASYAVAGPAVDALGPRGVYLVGAAAAAVGVVILLPILRHGLLKPTVEGGPAEPELGLHPIPGVLEVTGPPDSDSEAKSPAEGGVVAQPSGESEATARTS